MIQYIGGLHLSSCRNRHTLRRESCLWMALQLMSRTTWEALNLHVSITAWLSLKLTDILQSLMVLPGPWCSEAAWPHPWECPKKDKELRHMENMEKWGSFLKQWLAGSLTPTGKCLLHSMMGGCSRWNFSLSWSGPQHRQPLVWVFQHGITVSGPRLSQLHPDAFLHIHLYYNLVFSNLATINLSRPF